MSEKYISTPEHFEQFKGYCRQWLAKFGLTDWEIYYSHEDSEDACAWCGRKYEGKIATLGLCIDLSTQEPTPANLHKWARHEVMHVLLADLAHLVNLRSITDNIVSATEHAVIRRLESAFGECW